MAGYAPIQVSNVAPEHVANMLAALAVDKAVVVATVSPDRYSIIDAKLGLTVAAAYSPVTQILMVQVVAKPFFVSLDTIHEQIVRALG